MIRIASLLFLICLAGCAKDDSSLVVFQLRTDFVAGVEFNRVELRLDGVLETTRPLAYQDSVRNVLRISELELSVGTYLVDVRLLLNDRHVTETRVSVQVDLPDSDDAVLITVQATRSCASLQCDGGLVCFRGNCVDSECAVEEPPDACDVDVECQVASDCDQPASSCLESACLAGSCFERQARMCGERQVCLPESGCVSLPCAQDEFVMGGACVACPSGTENAPGDSPDGPDTACDMCAEGACCIDGETRDCVTSEACVGVQRCVDGEFRPCEGGISAHPYFADSDGDGFGNPDSLVLRCEPLEGLSENGLDCNDNNALVNPMMPDDTCDFVDDDCDGAFDEGFLFQSSTCGVGACERFGEVRCVSGMVQDSCVARTPPVQNEVACDNYDEDCDGLVDEGLATVFQWDEDRDGYLEDAPAADRVVSACSRPFTHPEGSRNGQWLEQSMAPKGDCDDSDPNVHPGAMDRCGIDFDCDSNTDPWAFCPCRDSSMDCGCESRDIGGSLYILCSEEQRLYDAEQSCRRIADIRNRGERIDLAKVESMSVDAAIDAWMGEASSPDDKGAWIGLRCFGNASSCYWRPDGAPASFEDFPDELPGCNVFSRNEVVIGRIHDTTGEPACGPERTWSTVDSFEARDFLCLVY